MDSLVSEITPPLGHPILTHPHLIHHGPKPPSLVLPTARLLLLLAQLLPLGVSLSVDGGVLVVPSVLDVHRGRIVRDVIGLAFRGIIVDDGLGHARAENVPGSLHEEISSKASGEGEARTRA